MSRRSQRFSWPLRQTSSDWRKTPCLPSRSSRPPGRLQRAMCWTTGTSSATPAGRGSQTWLATPLWLRPRVSAQSAYSPVPALCHQVQSKVVTTSLDSWLLLGKRHNISAKNLECRILLRANKDL